jgi:hypothetical protein
MSRMRPTSTIGFGFAVLALMVLVAGGSGPVDADTTSTTNANTNCSSIHLSISNPSPGDVLTPGNYVINGQAFDTTGAASPSIDRVEAFLDNPRDSGGRLLGQVSPNDTAPHFLTASTFALLVNIPNTPADNNTHQLFVYARSQQSGAEVVLGVTFQLNKPLAVDPFTPTPTPPPDTLSLKPCGSPTPTPTFPPFPQPTAGATPGVSGALTLRLGNPQPGDSVSPGMYVFQGQAFDPSAQGSSGVDRVQIFLDPREQGGQVLGNAQLGPTVPLAPFGFQLTAALPNRKGNHQLTVYAHSSETGQEASVSVPITIN